MQEYDIDVAIPKRGHHYPAAVAKETGRAYLDGAGELEPRPSEVVEAAVVSLVVLSFLDNVLEVRDGLLDLAEFLKEDLT